MPILHNLGNLQYVLVAIIGGALSINGIGGLTIGAMFERVLPEDKKHLVDECKRFYRNYYLDEGHCVDTTKLFGKVKEILQKFKEQGFYIAMASGKPKRGLDKMVKHFELEEVFDLVLGTGESNFKSKPDPGIINYIMEELNVSKEDTVMVGDSKTDILAGQNAGIDTIAATYGFDKKEILETAKPTCMIDKFEEIVKIIKIKKQSKKYEKTVDFKVRMYYNIICYKEEASTSHLILMEKGSIFKKYLNIS